MKFIQLANTVINLDSIATFEGGFGSQGAEVTLIFKHEIKGSFTRILKGSEAREFIEEFNSTEASGQVIEIDDFCKQ